MQETADKAGGVVFLSGHMHVSPNVLVGNGEYGVRRGNVYLDCGSVMPTDTSGEKGFMSPDWKDGIEACTSSIESGVRFPRGYYRLLIIPKGAVPWWLASNNPVRRKRLRRACTAACYDCARLHRFGRRHNVDNGQRRLRAGSGDGA